ncbi:MAG: hypothetical protein ACOCYZ_06565, partial [Halococcoides sp.]
MIRTRTDDSGRDRAVDLRPALGLAALIAVLDRHGSPDGVRHMGLLDGLGDIIVSAIQELLRVLFSPIEGVIEAHGDALLEVVVQTPHPDAVFAAPSNGPWPAVHGYYWETIVPLSLSLWGLAIGVVILLESTSHLFSNYHRSKLKKRAFSGLIGILSWWWLAALSLRFMDALAKFLLPSLEEIALFETASFAAIGVIGLVISLSVDLALFVIIGLIYLIRQLVLYLFVLLMPILIVLWVPGVGPFTLVSRFMKKLAGFYVPFLFMSVPVALLFRVGGLLGQSASLSAGGIGTWLTALVVPFAAVLSPFVLFWQAGAIMFMADRAARHVSAQRARRRSTTGKEQVERAGHSGRNFVRGVRGKSAVRRDGEKVFGSGDSTANAVGRRVNRTGSRLGERLRRGGDDGDDGSDWRSNGGSDRRSDGGTRESRTDDSGRNADAGSGDSDAGRSTTTNSDRSDRGDRSDDRSGRGSDEGSSSDSSGATSRDRDTSRSDRS